MSLASVEPTAVYVLGAHDLPMILVVAVVGYIAAMLVAVVARRYLLRALAIAHYTLRTLPKWCGHRIAVERRGPSSSFVVLVRGLIADGAR